MTRGRAFMVVDLGYGDAGKGTVVDYLARRHGAGLVVRFNGGPQAAHNVVLPSGGHHAFSTWGSGTLAGVPTWLGHRVWVNPLNAFREANHLLLHCGVRDPWGMLYVDPRCPVITPWHVFENRAREVVRGDGRHGSCGEGLGAARADVARGEVLTVADLVSNSLPAVARYLARLRDRKVEEIRAFGGGSTAWCGAAVELAAGEVAAGFREFVTRAQVSHGPPPVPGPDAVVIFEGAQGVLIDQTHGIGAPDHATWSDCTFANAEEIRRGWFSDYEPVRLGVVRTYMVRHGPGPFPTETRSLDHLPEPHNRRGPWQGPVRRGWFDFVAVEHAINACGGVDALAVTHLDVAQPGWFGGDPVRKMEQVLAPVPVALGSHGPTYQDKTEDPRGWWRAHKLTYPEEKEALA